MTLIRSNPNFKLERAKFFFSTFNFSKKTLEEVEKEFRRVDLMCNAINEKTGKNIDAEEMYLMVISAINDNDPEAVVTVNIDALYLEMDVLLMRHLPVHYSSDTIKVLQSLKQSECSTISLLSNTGFIKGQTLRRVLHTLELDAFLDFQLYSDEVGFSKPNPFFFQLMLDKVKKPGTNITLDDIIHVGDNPVADVVGAQQMGIQSLLINSNHLTINKLLN